MEKESVNLNTKTHRRLRRAYCRLIKEKGKEKINVSNLTNEADISRATFYLYYKDIEEFKDSILEYILNAFIKQIYILLIGSRSEVLQKCKRKNLFFTDDDFELFHCLYANNKGFSFDPKEFEVAFDILYSNTTKHFSERFINKNESRFELFYIGYSSIMKNNFLDYHSDKVARDVLRTMDVWDDLFPEHKFKN